MYIHKEESHNIEQETLLQSKCEKWFQYRMNRITSSVAHKVFTRQRNFESLVTSLTEPKPHSELPQIVKDAMEHGTKYEPIARKKYFELLKYDLKRDVDIRETGLVIQPNLFWVAASPDGLVSDKSEDGGIGLIEIKCLK